MNKKHKNRANTQALQYLTKPVKPLEVTSIASFALQSAGSQFQSLAFVSYHGIKMKTIRRFQVEHQLLKHDLVWPFLGEERTTMHNDKIIKSKCQKIMSRRDFPVT